MNILFLTPQVPYPPDRGTALRNWGLLSTLAARHRVALLTFAEDARPLDPDSPLFATTHGRVETVPVPPTRSVITRLRALALTRTPDLAQRLVSPTFTAHLRAWLAREAFDVIHVEGLELAPYIPVIRAGAHPAVSGARGTAPRPLIVFDAHNAEWLLQQRAGATDQRSPRRWHAALYSAVQWRRLHRYERDACRAADRVVAVSSADADALRALDPALTVHVVPNGVFLADFAPAAIPTTPVPAFDALFTGKMDYRPNVDAMLWFCAEIWPRLRATHPQATLGIVGQKPHAQLATLHTLPGVTVTGYVPDTRPYLARAAVYIAPLRMGGGTRFKLLEAMALEKAIVSTQHGAEGLGVPANAPTAPLHLADTPEAFAAAVSAFWRDPAARAAIGTYARAHVATHFAWEALVPTLEQLYG